MLTRRHRLAAVLAVAYLGLAAVSLLARDCWEAVLWRPLVASGLPGWAALFGGCSIVGPPLLLVWGPGAIPVFLLFTASLAACALWYARSGETRPIAAGVAALLWMLGGLLSYAMSI